MISSFSMATKFRGPVDSLLISLNCPLCRPEFDRGVFSSGVAHPSEFQRGAGVIEAIYLSETKAFSWTRL